MVRGSILAHAQNAGQVCRVEDKKMTVALVNLTLLRENLEDPLVETHEGEEKRLIKDSINNKGGSLNRRDNI